MFRAPRPPAGRIRVGSHDGLVTEARARFHSSSALAVKIKSAYCEGGE